MPRAARLGRGLYAILDISTSLAYIEGEVRPVGLVLRNRLKVARAERGLSQEQLAAIAGVTRQTISSIENVQYVPSTHLAFVLARCLRKAVEELFYLEEE